MTSTPSLRIGFIGAGANTRLHHLPRLKAIPGVELASVCNRSIDSAQQVAKEFGIAKVAAHWKDVVEDDTLDAIVIGTWPDQHRLFSCAALEQGKHVLCEARMTTSASEARIMQTAAQARPELVAQIVPAPFTFRFDRTIQDLIAQGYLGEICAIRAVVAGSQPGASGKFLDSNAPLGFRQDFDRTGYNTLALGIWYESLMRWVGEATRVMAMTKVVAKQRLDPRTGLLAAVRVPDHVDVIADMACGAQANLQFSSVAGLQAPGAEVWLFGSEGTLRLDASAGKLFGGRRGDAALLEIAIEPAKAGSWRVEEEFVNAIRGLEPVRFTTFADGVKYMDFTEAVARSAASGAAVGLPLRAAA